MERIIESKFNVIPVQQLKLIRGGDCTGGGASLQRTVKVGNTTYDVWNSWDADSSGSDGSTSYTNYSCTWYSRHEA